MQYLMLGSSGSGKSYEATVYQVLEALKKGRKVITNLPLNVEEFNKIDNTYGDLIELRTRAMPIKGTFLVGLETHAFALSPERVWREQPVTTRPFSTVWDFYDVWRHPVSGVGALFIVDEAQYAIPVGKTDIQVEEYTALHRHWLHDILWLTQSYGKLSKVIRENVEMVYRFRKKTAWGQPDRYIRKVQDGVRGEVLNVTERKYEKQFFRLYKSHTQSDGAGSEAMAQDVVPIWRHWSFMGAGAMALIFIAIALSGKLHNPLKPELKAPIHKTIPPQVLASIKQQIKDKTPVTNFKEHEKTVSAEQSKSKPKDSDEPLSARGIHIIAHIKSATKESWLFAVSTNGQKDFTMSLAELHEAGYEFKPMGDCVAEISFKDTKRFIACDSPSQSVPIGGSTKS